VTRLEVWAPHAGAVEVVLGDERIAMERSGESFAATIPDGEIDYAFSVDGRDPVPDPRSGHQPDGVHGPSRVVDHQGFEWTDGGWGPPPLRDWVVYELHVGTFTPEGTFEAVIAKLDQLSELGIDAIELMPVAEFPGARGWGYDGVDLYAPHHAYGGPDGLKRLVDAAHSRGIAMILDVVYNHLGPAGNYLREFGPYFTDKYATPWGEAINLDGPDSDGVRRFIVDNALYWLRDYHFDALRLDAVHAIVDASATHILEQIAREVAALSNELGRQLYVIAESDLNDPRLVRRWDEGGYGLDAQWNDDFHHALHALLTGENAGYYSDFGSVADLARALEKTFVYAGDYSPYRRRRHGRSPEGIPKDRFLTFLQNHDQVGNRARGDRTSALLSTSQLKLGAAVVLLSPYIPMVFQGEEWAASTPFRYFTDHADPELGRAVSEGRKREFASFGWAPEDIPDPQAPATFETSKLDWNELDDDPHKEILDWHRQLIALRKKHVTPGYEPAVSFDDSTGTLEFGDGSFLVKCDFGRSVVEIEVDGEVVLA
jgi:maltooligosyltrehalose trehalohydrolase